MEVVIGFSMLKRRLRKDKTRKRANCRNMPKRKERRKKTEEKERGQNCTLPDKKLSRLRSILYFSYQLLEPSKHFCTLSWGAYSTNFHLFFLRNISIIIHFYYYSWVSKHSGKDQGPTGKVFSISGGFGSGIGKKVG